MKPETRDRLLVGVDSATAKLTQFPSIESVLFWLWEFSGRVHQKLEDVHTREQIAALLDAEPEPSTTDILMFESVIRFSPLLLNRALKKVARGAAKGLPENPSGPKRVTEQSQNVAICEFIGGLYAKGVSVQDAQKRSASKWHISFRSVERIWAQRKHPESSLGSVEESEKVFVDWWQEPS